MKSILTFIASIAIVANAFAQPNLPSSYVSIQMVGDAIDTKPMLSTVCGGVLVDEARKLIATAWHCVPNSRALVESVDTFSVNGKRAKLVTIQADADVALFQVEGLEGVKAATIATPREGEKLISYAYYENFPVTQPINNRFIPPMSITRVMKWASEVVAVDTAWRMEGPQGDQRVKSDISWVVAQGVITPGFSGGPVYDEKGNLVGIVSNTYGAFTNIGSAENIRKLMENLPK